MRKVSLLVIAFISFLLVWSSNEEPMPFSSLKPSIQELKAKRNEVLEKAAQAAGISQDDKDNAARILDKAFSSLDNVIMVYPSIKDDPSLQNDAQIIIADFCDKYNKAIIRSDNNPEIQISTRKFLTVAEEYTSKFEELYKKANIYIDAQPPNFVTEDPKDGTVDESQTNIKTDKPTYSISFWNWFVSILGLIIGCIALYRVGKANNRITKRHNEIQLLESRLRQQINQIESSNYKGPTVSKEDLYRHRNSPRSQIKRAESASIPTPCPKHKDPTPQPPTKPVSTATNLFATIKASSPLAEFFKVASENSGDKVFMLTLQNPDAEIADFTIVPDMTPDFMKSVIVDRDTYLPAIFCEKSIDSQNPSRIEVLSQGRAKKIDGKWQVQERMSIRLV